MGVDDTILVLYRSTRIDEGVIRKFIFIGEGTIWKDKKKRNGIWGKGRGDTTILLASG